MRGGSSLKKPTDRAPKIIERHKAMVYALMALFFCLFLSEISQSQDVSDAGFVREIMPYQVFPSRHGKGVISFRAQGPGRLEARVEKESDGAVVARAEWDLSSTNLKELALKDVPVGGEYTVRCRLKGRETSFAHILVGELWIAGGQSNALGAEGEPYDPIPQVHLLRDGKWQQGRDPLFPWFGNQIHITPWIQAAREYFKRTGIPVGLLGYCAPAMEIDFFMDRSHKELLQLKPIVQRYGRGASVFLWYQGESDCEAKRRVVYKDRLHAMAAAIRRDARNPALKVVIVQLSYLIDFRGDPTAAWGKMREVQRQFCLEDAHAILAPALPYPHKDAIHLGAAGARGLGDRIALALTESRQSDKPVWQGPRPVSARFVDGSKTRIRVEFDSAKELRLFDAKWEDKGPRRNSKEDWFVTDDAHRGQPELLDAKVEKGVLKIQVSGGRLRAMKVDEGGGGELASLNFENTGFLRPTSVTAEGLSVILELPGPAGDDTKVSYALLSSSRCTLTDEQGKPAAAFADLPVTAR